MATDRWVFGNFLFVLRVYTGYYFYQASVFLVCALNISKLTCMLFALRARLRCRRTGHLVGGMMWVLSLTWPIFFLFVNPGDLYFDYRVYVSNYAFTDPIWGRYLPVLGALLGTVPNLVVLVTTVWLLVIACRASCRTRNTLQWQGISTVCMIAVVYCVSNVPFTISLLAEKSLTQYDSYGNPVGYFYIEYHRFAWNIIPLNNVANVAIYTWSTVSFRRFVSERVLRRRCTKGLPTMTTSTVHCMRPSVPGVETVKLNSNLVLLHKTRYSVASTSSSQPDYPEVVTSGKVFVSGEETTLGLTYSLSPNLAGYLYGAGIQAATPGDIQIQVDSAQVATSITVLDRAYRIALSVTQVNARHTTVFYKGEEDNSLVVVVGDVLGFKVIPEKGRQLIRSLRSRDWLSANQGPVFTDLVGSCLVTTHKCLQVTDQEFTVSPLLVTSQISLVTEDAHFLLAGQEVEFATNITGGFCQVNRVARYIGVKTR
eukprot:sb/3464231/